MRGRRTFQAYLPKDVQEKIKQKGEDEEIVLDRGTSAITRLNETIHWDYIPAARNFVDTKTGELLTEYRPTATFERLLLKLNGEETTQADTRPRPVSRPYERDPVLDIVAKSENSAFTTLSGSGATASLSSQAERFRRSKILTPHPQPERAVPGLRGVQTGGKSRGFFVPPARSVGGVKG